MNVSGADLYSGLQKIFPDEKDLTLTERLEAARGPLLSGIRGIKEISPEGRTRMPTGSGSPEIMLQQTRVEAVKALLARFMECVFPTDCRHWLSGEEEELFKVLGRSRILQQGQKSEEKRPRSSFPNYGRELPADHRALLALPGIRGSYTAGAIGSIAFGLPVQRWTEMSCRSFRKSCRKLRRYLKTSGKEETKAAVERGLKRHSKG